MNGSGDLKAFGKPGTSAKVEYIVVSDRETYPFNAQNLGGFHGPGPFEQDDLEDLARAAAEYDYSNCDGWERTRTCGGYPIEVELYVDGAPAGRFSVDIDFSPEFTARKCADTSSEVPL